MKTDLHPIVLLALTACADVGSSASDPPDQVHTPARPAAADAPDEPAPPSTVAATPARPEIPADPELTIRVEGRCRHLGVSLVDARPLVHYEGAEIARLADDGSIAETIATKLPPRSDGPAWEESLPRVVRLGGHWPGTLTADVVADPREGMGGVYLRDANGWREATPFGELSGLDRTFNWYDGSILAAAAVGENNQPRFAVLRGKPKGPRFDAARRQAGCTDMHASGVHVRDTGDVVAIWGCSAPMDRAFFTHWHGDDLAGHTHPLASGTEDWANELSSDRIAYDGSDGFYVLSAPTSRQRLWHGHGADWAEISVPDGGPFSRMATDPQHRVWLAGRSLVRRDGETWTEIAVPGKAAVVRWAGVEHGTPWLQTDERKARALLRVRSDDTLVPVEIPPSAFFADEQPTITDLHALGPDDVWAEAEFVVQRHGKDGPGRYYRAVMSTRPGGPPLRCGEVVDGRPLARDYVPWPTAANASCRERMSLLLRQRKWDDGNDYAKFARATAAVPGREGARFVEIEIADDKFFAAIAADGKLLDALASKTKKLRPYKFPEVVCGDAEVLDRAGVKLHREITLPPR